jgi:hypothetical protein
MGVRNENNRQAHQVLVDTGAEKPRPFNDVRVDIDYEYGIVEISDGEGLLMATAPLGRTLILWEKPPGGRASVHRLRV